MTPRQRVLARQALGLIGDRTHTYQNNGIATPDTDDYAEWMDLVRDGFAGVLPSRHTRATTVFFLTDVGAVAVLESTDTLHQHDFQNLSRIEIPKGLYEQLRDIRKLAPFFFGVRYLDFARDGLNGKMTLWVDKATYRAIDRQRIDGEAISDCLGRLAATFLFRQPLAA